MPEEVKFETDTGARPRSKVRRGHSGTITGTMLPVTVRNMPKRFAMGDEKLTLTHVIQERYMNSEFAFSSTCHTAVGDASAPDEVLHLVWDAMFRIQQGVGTLWRVDDSIVHRVVTRFFKEMFKHTVIDFGHAAAVLNTATAVGTADESLEKLIVFAHLSSLIDLRSVGD